jgi:hypothetical protein
LSQKKKLNSKTRRQKLKNVNYACTEWGCREVRATRPTDTLSNKKNGTHMQRTMELFWYTFLFVFPTETKQQTLHTYDCRIFWHV